MVFNFTSLSRQYFRLSIYPNSRQIFQPIKHEYRNKTMKIDITKIWIKSYGDGGTAKRQIDFMNKEINKLIKADSIMNYATGFLSGAFIATTIIILSCQ